jgi:hypothetical protein
MKTITTEVYGIDELDDKAKDKARQWYKDADDYPFLEDYMLETARELLTDAGIVHNDDIKVYYSLSWCQGDGAMLEGSGVWTHDGITYTWTAKHAGMYYHYNSKSTTLTYDDGVDADDDIMETFNDLYVDICRKLEKAGYGYIDEEQADANVDEQLRVNEFTFTRDGKRFG